MKRRVNQPSKVLLMLVRGSLASRSSSTTSVFFNSAGSCRLNWFILPGNQDGGAGRVGNGIYFSIIIIQGLLLRSSVYRRRECQETQPDSPRVGWDRRDTGPLVNCEHVGGFI